MKVQRRALGLEFGACRSVGLTGPQRYGGVTTELWGPY